MKPKQPERTVSKMDVLKDIKGLLSTAQEREVSAEAGLKDEDVLRAKAARLEEELRRYQQLARTQEEELAQLKREKEERTSRLDVLYSVEDKSRSAESEMLREEIAQLETTKAELSLAVSQIEELLQYKVKELLRRIARLFDEAGNGEIAMELKRVGNELENVENFAHFLRALLK